MYKVTAGQFWSFNENSIKFRQLFVLQMYTAKFQPLKIVRTNTNRGSGEWLATTRTV